MIGPWMETMAGEVLAGEILPFTDRGDINQRLDREIVEREREQSIKDIADHVLSENDVDRVVDGDVEP